MDPQLYGLLLYGISIITMGGIYSVLTLGLNMHWGLTGILNIGIAGFFGIGAYTSAILASKPDPNRFGGFDLPLSITFPTAMIMSAIIAYIVAKICIRLRTDYLAIATIGIAEILRLFAKNQESLTGGTFGINVSRPFQDLAGPWNHVTFMLLVLAFVLVVYLLCERARLSPWGRVMRALRDNEDAARALGKNIDHFRTVAFVAGASFMGLAGALSCHYIKYIGPTSIEPLQATFLVWVMLIVGGSGSNKGAIFGAMFIWLIWSASELFAWNLPSELATRAAFIRVFIIGFVLVFMLQYFEKGVFGPRKGEN